MQTIYNVLVVSYYPEQEVVIDWIPLFNFYGMRDPFLSKTNIHNRANSSLRL